MFAATLVRALQSCCSVWSSSVRTLIFLCECTSWVLSDRLVALSVVASLFLHTTQSVRRGGSCSVTVRCVAAGVCLDNIKSDFFSPTTDARDDYSSSGIGALSAIPSSLSSFSSVLQIMAIFLNFVWSMVYTELRFRRVDWISNLWKSSVKNCAYTEPHHPPHIVCAYGEGEALKRLQSRVATKVDIIWVSELGDICRWVCFPIAVDIPNRLLHVCALAVKKLSANIYG